MPSKESCSATEPKQRAYLGKIQISGQHLLGVIDGILDFSKIEAGKMRLHPVDFDLHPMLEKLRHIMGVKATERNLRLLIEIDPQLPARLHGDPLRLSQILINFVNNAIKFTEQGQINLRIEQLERTDNDLQVAFTVEDSGIGMTSEQIGRLFQSFEQADASITRKYGGTGLGLAICKQLAQLMDGEVGVRSEPGQGSTFWLRLRLAHALPT